MFYIKSDSIINYVLLFAAYTYGPLLGLFSFGLMTQYKIKEKFLPLICLFAPLATYVLERYGQSRNFELGFMVLFVNGFFTFCMLYLIRTNKKYKN